METTQNRPQGGARLAAAFALLGTALLVIAPVGVGVAHAGGTRTLAETFTDAEVRDSFAWSAAQAAASATIGSTFGVVSAFAWARYRYVGRSLMRGLVLLPLAFPPTALALGICLMLEPGSVVVDILRFLGIGSAEKGTGTLIFAHALFTCALVHWTTGIGFAGVEERQVDAARTLGAGPLRAGITVVLPIVAPSVAAGTVVGFGLAFVSYGFAAILEPTHVTPEGLIVAAAAVDRDRAAAIAALTALVMTCTGALGISMFRRTFRRAQRQRPRRPVVGPERLVLIVAALPPVLTLCAVTALASNSVIARGETPPIIAVWQGAEGAPNREALVTSLLVALAAGAVAGPWAIAAGTAFARARGVAGWISDLLLLLPVCLSPAVLAVGWIFLDVDGPIMRLPLAHAALAVPLSATTFALIGARPPAREIEASRSLGASAWRARMSLRGPYIALTLITTAGIAFARSLGESSAAVVTSGDTPTATARLLRLAAAGDTADAAAIALTLALLAVLAFGLADPLVERSKRRRSM